MVKNDPTEEINIIRKHIINNEDLEKIKKLYEELVLTYKCYLESIYYSKLKKLILSLRQEINDYEEKIKKTIEREAIEKMRQREIELKHLAMEEQKRRIKSKFLEYRISCLWHMTHKDNISSILKYGILNHYDAHRLNVNRVDISDPDAQRWRESIEPQYNLKIHDYAPLYINPRNPMLYVRRYLQEDLCLLEISLSVLLENQFLITDGNAASRSTQFYNSVDNLELLPWDVLHNEYWTNFDEGKRKKCAEVLIYPKILPNFIRNIHCYSKNTLDSLSNCSRHLFLTKNLFF